MTTEVVQTPAQLAKLANIEHSHVQTCAANMVDHAIKCGGILAEVKDRLEHGAWLPWVEKHFKGGTRTAQVYLKLFANRDQLEQANTKSAAHFPDSIAGALRQIAPAQSREPKTKDPEPQSEAGKNVAAAVADYDPEVIDAEVVEDPPPSMKDPARKKWAACRTTVDSISNRLVVNEEHGPMSWANSFRQASTQARSLASELESLAVVVERSAS